MGNKAEGAERARLCRIQAALTTSPDVRSCLLRMADIYEAEGAIEAERATLPAAGAAVPATDA